jgi:hypothetical protein
MPADREEQKLGLRGGLKAVGQIEGKGRPKIGLEEFMAVPRQFGFTSEVLGGDPRGGFTAGLQGRAVPG